ncbi:5-formyltetrahydrofolate cyclo-ligase [Candidatus Peregrinibacteria bacterium]|nr:MAG: 5-formyltetrahydrofolate cyclo-ligase [Candidatus Peregrinibacteria bacterium]
MRTKETLRAECLKKRSALSSEIRAEKTKLIVSTLENTEQLKQSGVILGYWAINEEVNINEVLIDWSHSKTILLPRLINAEQFEVAPIESLADLKENRWRIKEPTTPAYWGPIDLILVPGVAFGKNGERIGMGKGYYDRFLKNHSTTPKWGLAFQEQILDQIPNESYDVPVDLVVTEKQVYQRK